MNAPTLQALLVDDSRMFRASARRRLEQLGIRCDEASSCEQAESLLRANEYTILVTELHLPDRHPYHLVIDLLRRSVRPLIVVVTDIREPRLAQHLCDEGVDDILFKPVDYGLMAAKLKARAAQWHRRWSPAQNQRVPPENSNASLHGGNAVTADDLHTKLRHLTGMFPLSTTAFDVFKATRDDEYSTEKIEQAVAKESSLAIELLRLANSGTYNTSTERINSLDKAIIRVGRRKIGELALAHTAKACLTQRVVPWLDVDLLWHRSMAASAAAEVLTKRDKSEANDTVVLASLMHGLGRVVLASLYPQVYEALLNRCEETRESLDDLEERCFPLGPGRVIARVLELWGLPESVWSPLAYCDTPDLHSSGRLLNSAVTIGNLATKGWQDFDRIIAPVPDDLVTSDDLRSALEEVIKRQEAVSRNAPQPSQSKNHARVRYARLSGNTPDLLASLLHSMASVDTISLDDLEQAGSVVIDCCDAAPYSLAPFVSERTFDSQRVIVANASDGSEFRRYGQVVSFPLSYGALRQACLVETPKRPAEMRANHSTPFEIPIAASFDAQL